MNSVFLETSKDGKNILRVNNEGKVCYLGSKYNQQGEIDNFVKGVTLSTEKDIYIVWGGLTLDHIYSLIPNIHKKSKILVFEANKEIYSIIKKYNLDEKLLTYKNIKLTNDIEELSCFINENVDEVNVEYVKQITFGNYCKIHSKELVEPYKIIKNHIMRNKIGKNTSLFFEKKWMESLLNNMCFFHKSLKLDQYKDRYKNKPAIIVSAGPSLSKNIHKINKESTYIFSGGRTLKPLLKHDIDPDFLTVVDSGQASFDLVDGYIDKSEACLIYNELTNSKVLNSSKGAKIVSGQSKLVNDIFNGEIEDIVWGGSVAHAMTFAAAYMGFNPIIFVGQDLAYTDDKGHASCASLNDKSVEGKNYYSEYDEYVKDNNGEYVRTSQVLKKFKDELEIIIKIFPEVKFINATEGGALIEGTKVSTLNEATKNLRVLKKEKVDFKLYDKDIYKKSIKSLEENLESINKLVFLCNDACETLKNLELLFYKNNNSRLRALNKQLNKIEKEIKNNINKASVLNSMIYKVTYELENKRDFVCNVDDTLDVRVKKGFIKNYELYKMIISICEEAKPNVENSLKRLMEDKDE